MLPAIASATSRRWTASRRLSGPRIWPGGDTRHKLVSIFEREKKLHNIVTCKSPHNRSLPPLCVAPASQTHPTRAAASGFSYPPQHQPQWGRLLPEQPDGVHQGRKRRETREEVSLSRQHDGSDAVTTPIILHCSERGRKETRGFFIDH